MTNLTEMDNTHYTNTKPFMNIYSTLQRASVPMFKIKVYLNASTDGAFCKLLGTRFQTVPVGR